MACSSRSRFMKDAAAEGPAIFDGEIRLHPSDFMQAVFMQGVSTPFGGSLQQFPYAGYGHSERSACTGKQFRGGQGDKRISFHAGIASLERVAQVFKNLRIARLA